MKITDKHRIAYKRKNAPGEPVEMAIFRDDEGYYRSAIGDIVTHPNGELYPWVREMLDGTSNLYVGEIIPPPLEPYVGMVIENPNDAGDYYVYFRTGEPDNFDWIDRDGNTEHTRMVQNLINQAGWEVVT